MNVTREDVLRELELLPVWKLRTPLVHAPTTVAEILEEKQGEIVAPTAPQNAFNLHVSEDKKWLFICPESRVDIGLQSTLFNNILHALKIDKTNQLVTENLAEINATVTVVMGEQLAQHLLKTQESLENLRGQIHQFQSAALIVTYSLADLLAKPIDKAKAWQDLCLARSYIESLSLQSKE
jgi:uracil-DNA glycosylase